MEPDTKTDLPVVAAPADISLVRGGPFYRAQVALKLVDPETWNVGRRILFAICITWLPLVLIRLAHNPRGIMQMLLDYRIDARLLIAGPALFLAEPIMESRFRMLIDHIRESHLLMGADLAKMYAILAGLRRYRDSILPELVILLIVVGRAVSSYGYIASESIGDLAFQSPTGTHLTPAGWYMMLVSAPFFQFVALVVVWKWLLWIVFAFQLSRLNLRLVPSHPDENGGLGFLSISTQAFVPIAFAWAAVIGASFRNDILNNGKHLANFKGPGIAFVVIVFAVALLPLLFFVPKLLPLRRKGILEYSTIGHMQSTAFHDRWVIHGEENRDEIIAAPEISTLCDYNSAYTNVEDMYPIPVDKEALMGLALSIAIPALPVILAEIPIATVLQDLLEALK
jgi:hypothetical protein